MALPGLAIFQKDNKSTDEILKTSLPNLTKLYVDQASFNNTSVDIPLWFFHCLNEMERFRGDDFNVADYYDTMKLLLDHYWVGVAGKMHRLDNGLIYARNEGTIFCFILLIGLWFAYLLKIKKEPHDCPPVP